MVGEVVDEGAADAAVGVAGVDRDLLDVEVAVDGLGFGEEVGDRGPGVVVGDPGGAGALVAGEFVEGEGIVVGDLGHADVAEAGSGGSLDVLEEGSSSGRAVRMSIASLCRAGRAGRYVISAE